MNNVRRATGSLGAFVRSLRGLFPLALWTATSLAWVAYSRAGILHDGLVALSLAIGIEFAMMVVRSPPHPIALGRARACSLACACPGRSITATHPPCAPHTRTVPVLPTGPAVPDRHRSGGGPPTPPWVRLQHASLRRGAPSSHAHSFRALVKKKLVVSRLGPWLSAEAERALLVIYLLGTLATYVHMSVSIVNQFCEFLKIRCLQLGPPPPHRA